jgi:hypothetical protein
MNTQHVLPAQANGPHETVRHVLLPPLQPARQAAATRTYAGYGVLALVGPRRAARRRRFLVRLGRGGVLHRGASNSAVRRPRASTAADRMPVRGRAALALEAPAVAARRHRLRLRLGSGGVLLMGARNNAVRRLRVGAAAAVRIPALAAAGALVAPAVAAAAVVPLTGAAAQPVLRMQFVVNTAQLPQLQQQFAAFLGALEQRFPAFATGLRVAVRVSTVVNNGDGDSPQVLHILYIVS